MICASSIHYRLTWIPSRVKIVRSTGVTRCRERHIDLTCRDSRPNWQYRIVQRGGRVQLPQYTWYNMFGKLGSVRLAPIIIYNILYTPVPPVPV